MIKCKEFVDIAAHELRTPIQPILGLSEVVRSKLKVEDKELVQLLDVIKRNAEAPKTYRRYT